MRTEVDRKTAPPLTVWMAGAALAIAAVLLLLSFPSPEQAVAVFLADHTRGALAQGARGDVQVIGMGSSLLHAATPSNERHIGDATGALHWARITKSNLGLGYLGSSFGLIEGAPPDVLVIEKNLLMEAAETDAMRSRRMDAMYTLKRLLSKLDGRFDPLLEIRAEQFHNRSCVDAQPLSDAQLALRQSDLRREYQKSPDPLFAAALLRLADRGVRIMILDIQRSTPIERGTGQDKQRWYARLHQMLPPGPHLSYHTGPSYSQVDLYCDASHMSAKGAKLFQAWWWNEFRQARKAVR